MDFADLYESHRDRVYQLALRMLGDTDMAVDAAQDAFRKAFEAQDSFRREARPSTWLFRIAHNVCVDALRRRRIQPRGLEETDSTVQVPGNTGPEGAAESGETGRRVRAALKTLGEEDRKLLCLQMDEDMGYEELASVLGCSIETVRMRVSRARRRLKESLCPGKEIRP